MGRIATSFTEQISLLKQRGMELDFSEEKVKEILSDIGYYRLGFYWRPFEKDKAHNFKEGTKFSEVVHLYYLDANLRDILSNYINRVELNFRTKLIYYVSNKYKNSPTWFVDPLVLNSKAIANFNKFYDDSFKQKNKAINNHHRKYINDKYAPAWKTLEFLTFANIVHIYKELKDDEIKKRISTLFKVNDISKFVNLLETMVYIRNVCAHNGVLFDLKTPKGISKLPGLHFDSADRHSLQASIEVLKYLLHSISENRKKELESKIFELIKNPNYSTNLNGMIELKMNFFIKNS